MVLTLSNIVIAVLLVLCAWLAAKWLFKKDTEIENRRRAAGHLAATLREMGFKDLPEFFIDYSVGDYSGMAYKLHQLAQKMMSGEKAVLAELEDVAVKLLAIKLKTPEGRLQVRAALEDAEKAAAPPAPLAPLLAPPFAPAAPLV
jgi:hypothetical protein